jgi:hypothetical protein
MLWLWLWAFGAVEALVLRWSVIAFRSRQRIHGYQLLVVAESVPLFALLFRGSPLAVFVSIFWQFTVLGVCVACGAVTLTLMATRDPRRRAKRRS